MPTSVVEEIWSEKTQIIDHWRAFELDNVAAMFAAHDHTNHSKNLHSCHVRHKHHCRDGILKVGSRNGSCKSQRECALLVSSYPGESRFANICSQVKYE